MSKLSKKLLSLVLALCLCANITMPVSAVGENNNAGVTFSLALSESTLEKSNQQQTVTLTIKASQEIGFSYMEYDLTCNNMFSLAEPTAPNGTASWNSETKHMGWMAGADVTTDTLGTIVVTIPANIEAGSYEFKVSGIELGNDDESFEETAAFATATLTITDGENPVVAGYSASITADPAVTVGQDVDVYVGVGHNSDSTFHAAEIVLNYDASKLELVTTSLDSNPQIKYTNVNGVLTIENFDEEHNTGTGVYTIKFKANVVGDTAVTLSSAKFLHKSAAHSSNLIPANINPNTATIQVKKATVKVSQAEGSVGIVNLATETPINEAFTFSVSDSNLYVYTVTATVGGNAAVVTDNKDGTYTIAANLVTGDIVITASRTGREFDVEWAGEGANDVTKPEGKPTYGADYVFTVPTNIKETATTPGYTYSASVSITGSEFSLSGAAGQTVTIPGAQIIGKVTINVTKTAVPANGKTVSITGQDVKFESGETTVVVSPGTELTLVLTPEAGYTYEVKVDGQAVTLTDNKYTIAVGDKDIAVTVTKTLDTETLNVGAYVTLDSQAGEKLWLVIFDPTLASGKIPTYDGANMFWSAEYDAYCFLVQANPLDKEIAAGKLGVATATADEVDYSGNVNRTTETDAADAQFVANMYNAMYNGVSDDVTMAMFLSADIDGSGVLNIEDAKTIILEKVLKSTN